MYSQDAVNYVNNFLSNIFITVNFIVTSQLPYPFINLLASLGEVVSVFTSLYLSAGAIALGEAKGLIKLI